MPVSLLILLALVGNLHAAQPLRVRAIHPEGDIAFPPELLACTEAKECTAVEGFCGRLQVVNRKYASDLESSYRSHDAEQACDRRAPKTRPELQCADGYCEAKMAPGMGHTAATAWLARCPVPKPLTWKRDTLPSEVKSALEDLSSPLDRVEARALGVLAHSGVDAKRAVPRIIDELQDAHTSTAQRCRIPENLPEQAYLDALEGLGPVAKDAVPTLLDLMPGESSPGVQEAFLKVLIAIGPDAAEAIPVLMRELAIHMKRGLIDYRGELCVRALLAIGPQARPALGELLPIVKKGGVFDGLAFQAMVAIAPDDPLTRQAAELVLGSDRPEVQEIGIRFVSLYRTDPDAELPKLVSLAKLSPVPRVRIAAVRAVGNFGKQAKPYLPKLLELRPRIREDREFQIAIRKIDPTGNNLFPLLDSPLFDASTYRESMTLVKWLRNDSAWRSAMPALLHRALGLSAEKARKKVLPPELFSVIRNPEKALASRMAAMDALAFSGEDRELGLKALEKAMGDSQAAVRWEASSAWLLLTGRSEDPALHLQLEALERGGQSRLLDTSDVIASLPTLPETFEKALVAIARRSYSPEAVEAWMTAVGRADGVAREALTAELSQADAKHAPELIRQLGWAPEVSSALILVLEEAHRAHPELTDVIIDALEDLGSTEAISAAKRLLVAAKT